MTNKNAYAQSGVDVEVGNTLLVRNVRVMGALGGVLQHNLSKTGVKEPVLISGAVFGVIPR